MSPELHTGSHADLQLENDQFRVTKWTIEPNGAIPMHRHDYEYVVVPLVTATMHVVNADGSLIVAELVTGQSYTRPAGAEHQVENRGTSEAVIFVEVERLS
ncbi:MAG: cupin domain-containing protein [Leucobacter sp.]